MQEALARFNAQYRKKKEKTYYIFKFGRIYSWYTMRKIIPFTIAAKIPNVWREYLIINIQKLDEKL